MGVRSCGWWNGRRELSTSRYFGLNVDLLGKYAWYLVIASQDHAWRSRQPAVQRLGSFGDAQGNVFEWCQGLPLLYSPDRAGAVLDHIRSDEYNHPERSFRGAAFVSQPALVRSAAFAAANSAVEPCHDRRFSPRQNLRMTAQRQ